MRGVRPVGRHLHRQLPTGGERLGPAAQHGLVVGHPLQARVGQDEVPATMRFAGGRPGGEVAVREADVHLRRELQLPGALEHGGRRIDADERVGPEESRRLHTQRAVATSEIDHPVDRGRVDEADQVPERLRPFRRESSVLVGIPIAHVGEPTCI